MGTSLGYQNGSCLEDQWGAHDRTESLCTRRTRSTSDSMAKTHIAMHPLYHERAYGRPHREVKLSSWPQPQRGADCVLQLQGLLCDISSGVRCLERIIWVDQNVNVVQVCVVCLALPRTILGVFSRGELAQGTAAGSATGSAPRVHGLVDDRALTVKVVE